MYLHLDTPKAGYLSELFREQAIMSSFLEEPYSDKGEGTSR